MAERFRTKLDQGNGRHTQLEHEHEGKKTTKQHTSMRHGTYSKNARAILRKSYRDDQYATTTDGKRAQAMGHDVRQ